MCLSLTLLQEKKLFAHYLLHPFGLIHFFESIGMNVLDFDLVEAQGGSIRVYVGHIKKTDYNKKIINQIKLEEKIGLFDEKLFKKFYSRIINQKKVIRKFILSNIKNKKKYSLVMGHRRRQLPLVMCLSLEMNLLSLL